MASIFRDNKLDFTVWYARFSCIALLAFIRLVRYTEVLSKELANADPARKVLRRRVLWLLGEWADELPIELRKDIYVHVTLLMGDKDNAVRLVSLFVSTRF